MYKAIIFIILSITCVSNCSKNLIQSNSKFIKPEYVKERSLSISNLINLTKDPEYKNYQISIAKIMKEELKKVKIVKIPNQIILENKKDILSNYKIKVKKPKEKTNKSSTNELDKLKEKIKKAKAEYSNIKNYIKLYIKKSNKVKTLLGININQTNKNNYEISKLKIKTNIVSLKEKNKLSIEETFQELESKDSDLFIIGMIKREKNKIKIKTKLYDKHRIKFLFEEDFEYSNKDFIINLYKNIKIITDKYKKHLTSFAKGKINIKTEPKEAEIFLNNKHIGKSDIKKDIKIGRYKLEIIKNKYTKFQKEIFIETNKENKIKVKLKKQENKSEINISSKPSQASVYLDSKYEGKTPLKIKNLKSNHYKLRLEKEGYKNKNKIIYLPPKENKEISLNLKVGKSKYINVNKLSKNINITKNVFFYSSFISSAAMLYAFLKEDQYKQKIINTENYNKWNNLYKNANKIKNLTIITTLSSLALTTIFQILELNIENIEIGFLPNSSTINISQNNNKNNLTGYITLKFLF